LSVATVTVDDVLGLIGYAYQVARVSTVLTFTLAVASAGIGVLLTFLVGQVVGAVPGIVAASAAPADGQAMSLVAFGWLLAALLTTFVVQSTLPALDQVARWDMSNRTARDIGVRITDPLLAPHGIRHLEDPQIQDEQERAKGKEGYQLAFGLRIVPDLVSSRLTLLGSAYLVGQMFSWPVAASLAAVTLFMEWHRKHVVEGEIDSWWGLTEGQRRAWYTFELGMRDAPKEVRVFGLSPWLVRRHREEWLAAMRPIWQARSRGTLTAAAVGVVHIGAHAAAIVLVGRAAMAGQLPLTQVATAVPAILAVGMSYNGFAAVQTKRAATAFRAMRNLPSLIQERHPQTVAAAREHSPDVSRMPHSAICFEQVSFRYPGSEIDVLSGLDLEIRAGEALALVGLNGAGKSTMVKLLAGVYPPTEGRITVDGVDLRELDLTAWQRRIAAIVQDFLRFPLSATDNVVLGAAEHATDAGALATVAGQAGIGRVVDTMPAGWNTVLDKTYDGGIDLSGGEWQRVALARALFAVEAGARVLVLDEPAAALDVRAEAELVERYLDLTSGLTSLIISHRFSVVRDAHRICVLDGGRIVESGTHKELLALDGRYAGMFSLQAERYVAGERKLVSQEGRDV
jgi:ABC-type transport system involved in cytochrome bd biosynthesis fused ATPase/permease subunit